MNPLHAADISNAGTPGTPSSAPMKHAVDGNTISGVMVATMISSMSFGTSPADSIARRAAAAIAGLQIAGAGGVGIVVRRHRPLHDVHDLLVDAAGDELLADADGVLDRPRVRPAVADQAVPAHAQQRRAAVLLPVVLGV